MKHPTREARPPRPCAEYRWTNRKAHAFLDALAQHGKVAAAARAVGMTRQSAYKLRHRSPLLAKDWAWAQEIGRARRFGKATFSPAQGDTLRNAR
jgi:hypothetical protein